MKIRIVLIGLLLLVSLLTSVEGQEGEANIVTILRDMFPQAVIDIESLTNTLIVKAPPSLQERIEEMIRRLDVYHPQITVEAKFVELTVTDINELGIDLDIQNIVTGVSLDKGEIDIINDWDDSDTVFPQELAGASLWYTRLSDTAFNAVLRALEKQKKVNVLSAPMVTTLNGQAATIEITRTIPYIRELRVEKQASSGVQQITYDIEEKDAGIYLEVTPRVSEGSTLITLDIRPRVRELVSQETIFSGTNLPEDIIQLIQNLGWPIINERTTNTSMIIDSGETVVLGGLIKDDTTEVEKKVPILGDIPLLGYAFRHKYSKDEKKNLLIFITAYLLSPSGEKTVARR